MGWKGLTGMSLTMTEREFVFWLERSSSSSQVIYHYGSLPRDRFGKLLYEGEVVKQIPTVYSQAVDYVALAAWQAMRGHYVFLTPHNFEDTPSSISFCIIVESEEPVVLQSIDSPFGSIA